MPGLPLNLRLKTEVCARVLYHDGTTIDVVRNLELPARDDDCRVDEPQTHAGEVERAMREYVDLDEHARVEEMVDRLVRAAGRTPETLTNKKSLADTTDWEDTTRVRCRADGEVKEAFAEFAKHETEEPPGVMLGRALQERRDGGRSTRVERKLERVMEDAEALLAEMNPDAEGSMGIRERRTVAICSRLGPQFTRSDLEEAIGAVAGDSRPTLDDYSERVIDRLNHSPHPHNPDLFIPEDEAREMATAKADREMDRAMTGKPETGMATDGGEPKDMEEP